MIRKRTTFSMYLPGIKCEESDASLLDEPIQGGRERILVVDDDPALALALEKVLKMLGYPCARRRRWRGL